MSSHHIAARSTLRGFTLIECAIGMLVVTFMISALLPPLSAQIEQRQVSDTQATLTQIADALMGYSTANGYLPCPDLTSGNGANDGLEDLNGGATNCATAEGNIPWATLGIQGTDSWGNHIRYRVTTTFSDRQTLFKLSSSGNISVQCPASSCGVATTYTNSAPAVLVSHGRNGRGAVNALTRSLNPAASSADELANSDGNTSFISRTTSAPGAKAGEYDDQVVWLSTAILLNKMITAQKLP